MPFYDNKDNRAYAYKYCVIFTLAIFILLQAYPYEFVKAFSEPDISINYPNEEIIITSGELQSTTLNISNVGTSPLLYNVTYSTNLELDNNTVGLWYFNERYRVKVQDESPFGNDGSITGAVIVNGKFGKALKFDGVDDYVLVPDSPSLNVKSLSMETWIKINSHSISAPLGGVKYYSFGLQYGEEGILRPHVWAQGLKWYDSNFTLSTGEWYYLALTFDASSGDLAWYLNGVLMDIRNEGANSIEESASDLIFGRGWTENMWDLFDGIIDEVRISNISRSSAEIMKNYKRGISGQREWIQVSNESGIVGSGSYTAVNLIMNASNLAPGVYKKELVIKSNDPDTSYLILPITLKVIPTTHDVAITNIKTNDIVDVGEETFIDVIVSNLGTDHENELEIELKVDDEIKDIKEIQNLPSEKSTQITLSWTPSISGIYSIEVAVIPVAGESVLHNNYYQSSTLVSGLPEIEILRQSFEFSGDPGDVLQESMVITNQGFSNLTYILLDKYGPNVFLDEMEHGENEWIHSGDQDSWEWGVPLLGPQFAYSGLYCWGTGLSYNYRDFSDCFLESPLIDLTTRDNPQLEFVQWFSIDAFGDRGFVEIWNGSEWRALNPEGYKGYSNGWVHEQYNLSDYSGMKIKVRFRLSADEDTLDKGWFIDDVKILSSYDTEIDWLTESPDQGIIPPNTSKVVTITVVTNNLESGRHHDSILIRSNDHDEGIIEIPIKLIVQGVDIIPPIANAGIDIETTEDLEVQFDGTQSRDNFDISKYTWTLTDANTKTLDGVQPKYIFETPGTYKVELTVIDTSRNQAYDSLTVTVLDVTKPNSNAGKNLTAYVGNIISLDGSASTDNSEITTYEWNLGDGSKMNGDVITYQYTKAGTYNITLTVTDINGNTDIDFISAEIFPSEGAGTFVFFFFIIFFLAIVIIYQFYLIKGRMRKRERARKREVYRM